MTFGTLSSSPYVEEYASAASPLGPTSSDTYVNFVQASVFGPSSSDEFLLGTTGGVGLRGSQFRQNIIANDRFVNALFNILSVTSDIDLTTTGLTAIYTVPATQTALVTGVLLRITENQAFTAIPTISIDGVSTIFAAEPLTGLQGKNDIWVFWHDKSTTILANAADVISTNVTVAATATSLKAQAFLIGLLL